MAVDYTWAWLVSTAGLTALVAGERLVRRSNAISAASADLFRRFDFTAIALAGLVVTIGSLSLGISSGIGSNIGPLVLFGLGGLGFLDARKERISGRTVAIVLAAIVIGTVAGFKELATLPAVAWGIGLASGRARAISARAIAAVVLLGLFAYLAVAGQRIAAQVGDPTDFPHAVTNAVTRYDLRSGTVSTERYHGLGTLTNVGSAVSRRLSGVEALIILREAVPHRVEYQHGRSLVLPALTVLPRSTYLTGPSQFPVLSLGRYYAQTFYSLNPGTDPSSQAITWAGDLYLNFGTAGVIIGLAIIGGLIAVFDGRYPPVTAYNAGILAYVGTAAIGLERNVAYVLVTVLLRLGIISTLYWMFGTMRRKLGPPVVSAPLRSVSSARRSTN